MTRAKLSEITDIVAEAFGVPVSDIIGPQRLREYVVPRHVAYYLAHELGYFSMPQIGRHFGGRDHTTVLHGIRRVRSKWLSQYRTEIEAASDALQASQTTTFVRRDTTALVFRSGRAARRGSEK
jgi:chromosomal replication initiator protein